MAAKSKRLNISLDGQLNQVLEKSKIRLFFLISAIIITFVIIAAKTVKLTFFLESEIQSKRIYSSQSAGNNTSRPKIYDRNGGLISSNLTTSSLYVNPQIMIDKEIAAKELSKIFPDLDEKNLLEKFNSDKAFLWIKRILHPQQKYKVNELGIPGLMFKDEEKRIYPHANYFSHTVGMVGVDGKGLGGLERYIDGVKNKEDIYEDGNIEENKIKTTLDIKVQSVVREELIQQLKKHHAKRAVAIVLDVNDGGVISSVSLPDYDPNISSSIEEKSLFNAATMANYEMGSTFKPLTFAMAFEENKIKMWSSFDASKQIEISRFTINDFHAQKRRLSVPEILMYSSNIGTAKIAERLGDELMQKYFRKLGFYDKLDIEVAEKTKPIMPKTWREVTTLTSSYGHGIAVSPMHIASAFASTINGGYLYQPTILKNKTSNGVKVFSKDTSDKMRKLLRLVVGNKEGSGKKADVDGYFVGGKTGTAEKLDSRGRYSKHVLISSFIGVFPMNDPQYLVLVLLDEPKATKDTWGFATGGWVAAPVVGNIIERIGPILKVQPVDKDNYKIKQDFKVKYEL